VGFFPSAGVPFCLKKTAKENTLFADDIHNRQFRIDAKASEGTVTTKTAQSQVLVK